MRAKCLSTIAKDEAGFTWMELLVAAILLALLVNVMLPSYLGVRNQAAIAEGNAISKEWATLMYSCYQQNEFPTTVSATVPCFTNSVIGFTEPNGKFWAFATGSGTITSGTATASGVVWAMQSFPSMNAGLENGETFTVTLFLNGSQADTVVTSCVPVHC